MSLKFCEKSTYAQHIGSKILQKQKKIGEFGRVIIHAFATIPISDAPYWTFLKKDHTSLFTAEILSSFSSHNPMIAKPQVEKLLLQMLFLLMKVG